jgi:hypothetical protein
LVDDLILSYLVQLDETDKANHEKYNEIEKTIINFSDRLCKLMGKIVKELLPEEIEFVKENQ